MISRLPEPPRGSEKEARLAMLHDPHDSYAEAVRRLRTNLEFANVDRGARAYGQLRAPVLEAWADWDVEFGILDEPPAIDEAFDTSLVGPTDRG